MSTLSDQRTASAWVPSTADFGARLALIRWRRSWNTKEAATACGQPEATWRTWEHGSHPRDAVAVCRAIAARAGVDFYWLLTGEPSAAAHVCDVTCRLTAGCSAKLSYAGSDASHRIPRFFDPAALRRVAHAPLRPTGLTAA